MYQFVIQKEGEVVRFINSVIADLKRKAGPNFIPSIRVICVSLKTTSADPSMEWSLKTYKLKNRQINSLVWLDIMYIEKHKHNFRGNSILIKVWKLSYIKQHSSNVQSLVPWKNSINVILTQNNSHKIVWTN